MAEEFAIDPNEIVRVSDAQTLAPIMSVDWVRVCQLRS